MAALTPAQQMIAALISLGGKPEVQEETERYARIQLTDSTTIEVFEAENDQLIVLTTACAPQCSSSARVYAQDINKEWQLVSTLTPPFSSIFPLATMDKTTGRLEWTDNNTWEY